VSFHLNPAEEIGESESPLLTEQGI